MWFVYILYSSGCKRTYTGLTGNVARRLSEHNQGKMGGYTQRCRPWVLMHVEVFDVKPEAVKREQYFKTGRGREEKQKLLEVFLSAG